MGVIYYKNKPYASGGSTPGSSSEHIELTYAEYQALSEAEQKNGAVYFITDVDNDGGVTGYTGGTGITVGEDKVIAIKDIKKNYIDNSNFRINTRGQSEYTTSDSSIYTVDRWYIDGGILAPAENGIQFTNTNTSAGSSSLIRLKQDIPYTFVDLAGKTLILSAKINGTIYTGKATIPTEKPTEGTAIQYIAVGIPAFGINLNYSITGDYFVPYLALAYSQSVLVEWMKLEVNDEFSGYIEPDYMTELIKVNMTTSDKGALNLPYTKAEINAKFIDASDAKTVNGHTVNADVPADAKFTDTLDAETVNGHTVKSDVPENAKFTDTVYYYGVCNEDKSTIAKTVQIDNLGAIENGTTINILFVNGHSPSNNTPITLNVNGNGDKSVTFPDGTTSIGKYNGTSYYAISANEIVTFIYIDDIWRAISLTHPAKTYSGGSGASKTISESFNLSTNTYNFDDYGRNTGSNTVTLTITPTKASKTQSDVSDKKIGLKYQKGTGNLSEKMYKYYENNTGDDKGTYTCMYHDCFVAGEGTNGNIAQMQGGIFTATNGYYYNGSTTMNGTALYWQKYMGTATGFKFSNACIGAYLDNTITLGSADLRFKQLYAGTTTISTSDERKKENIKDISDAYKNILLNARPIIFTFKNENDDDTHDRVHCGFSAQDIKRLMEENGLDNKDFGGWCQTFIYNKKEVEHTVEVEDLDTEPIDGVYPTKLITYTSIEDDMDSEPKEDILALRYEEFIPIITSVVQDLNKENIELKARLKALEDRLSAAGI